MNWVAGLTGRLSAKAIKSPESHLILHPVDRPSPATNPAVASHRQSSLLATATAAATSPIAPHKTHSSALLLRAHVSQPLRWPQPRPVNPQVPRLSSFPSMNRHHPYGGYDSRPPARGRGRGAGGAPPGRGRGRPPPSGPYSQASFRPTPPQPPPYLKQPSESPSETSYYPNDPYPAQSEFFGGADRRHPPRPPPPAPRPGGPGFGSGAPSRGGGPTLGRGRDSASLPSRPPPHMHQHAPPQPQPSMSPSPYDQSYPYDSYQDSGAQESYNAYEPGPSAPYSLGPSSMSSISPPRPLQPRPHISASPASAQSYNPGPGSGSGFGPERYRPPRPPVRPTQRPPPPHAGPYDEYAPPQGPGQQQHWQQQQQQQHQSQDATYGYDPSYQGAHTFENLPFLFLVPVSWSSFHIFSTASPVTARSTTRRLSRRWLASSLILT